MMPTRFQLDSVARDGSAQTWPAELEHDAAALAWTYRVRASCCNDFYEARFKEIGTDHIQPDMLDRHDGAFRGKGLTEALFARAVSDTGRTLISSTNGQAKHFRSEYRSADAERVWRRLFAEERAEYDADADRFKFYPQGLPPSGVVRRSGDTRRPQFYVKGSYVLDVLFGTNYADDIDICWLTNVREPSTTRIAAWMRICALPEKRIRPTRVTDFFACEGGGAPIFNIDVWRIEMDGCAYEMDPATRIATRLLTAPPVTLKFLPNLEPFALMPSKDTNGNLDKALRKMMQHPSLADSATASLIAELKARPIPP